MLHAVTSPGKRLRPVLTLAVAELFGADDSVDAAVVVVRGSKAGSGLSRLRAPEPDDAARYLLELAQLRDLGRRTPRPLPLKPAAAWAETRFLKRSGSNARFEAGQACLPP